MKILSIDGALRCGWAFGDKTGRPYFGTWDLPGFSDQKRAASFASAYSAVQAMVRANNIEGVVIEAPLHLGGRSSHGERCLTMLSGALQAGACNGGAKSIWMPAPNTWRKHVLGNGFPKHAKSAAIEYCKLVLKIAVTDDNIADALCLWQFGHGQARLL